MTAAALADLRPGKQGFPVGTARKLADELARTMRGEVCFDAGSRALFATDASNYRQPPIGVVHPVDAQDAIAAAEVCRRYRAPILPRGGGTSLAGQCCNTAVVFDFTRHMNRVLSVDAARRQARVQPGTVLDDLRNAAKLYGLTFGPDPATHDHCTLGGMIGNNSCGAHAVLAEFYGPGPRTEHQVVELDVLTGDGVRLVVGATSDAELAEIVAGGGRRAEIYQHLVDLAARHADAIRERFPDIPRRVSGYNLPDLLPASGRNLARALVGSEGTCVLVLEALVTLVPAFPERVLLVLGYPSAFDAGDHVPLIRRFKPIACEGIDDVLIADLKKKHLHEEDVEFLPEGDGYLLVEFGGDTKQAALEQARALMHALAESEGAPDVVIVNDEANEARIWEVRESGLGATAFVPGQADTWPGWEDSAVPPDKVGDYLRELRALLEEHGYHGALYGHYGQGCIHTRIDFDFSTAAGVDKYKAFTRRAAELVARYGGSLSGEHGDGQARADLLPLMFGDELVQAFREFKAIWDPDGLMNPGKVVDAHPRDADLRLGPGLSPHAREVHFSYASDGGDFGHATMRCVGVGKCRRDAGGTMCPSYQATHDERYTTRGRAHLLFEMLRGEVLTDGWQSEAVKESLDLCLACKGCKSDCPVNVDMATYKAEFLAHYYEHRRRPRQAYAFGYIDRWARLASHAPGLVNLVTHAPGLSAIAKWAGGIAPARELPRFAARSFTRRFRAGPANPSNGDGAGRPRVVLWPDTFNNHFFPETLEAAVEVLEHAGFHVDIPDRPLCCGRPLYDYGMLDRAKALWREILDALGPGIDAGIPLVGLEPSCVAAFRDELPALFSHDPRARRLSGLTLTLAETLERARLYEPPKLRRHALWQPHCQHRAVMGIDAEQALFEKMRLEVERPNAGCCGMAGAFGFERDKIGVSLAIARKELVPAVERAPGDALIIADGFSCREQIRQTTGRRPLHLAEVIRRAIRESEAADERARPAAGLSLHSP